MRAIVALPLIPDAANASLENSTVVAKAWNGASTLAVPVEFGPDGIKGSRLEHFEFLITAVLPGHATQDTRVEVDTHADTAVEQVRRKRRVCRKRHDCRVVVAWVGVGSPSLGKGVLLGQQERAHVPQHQHIHVEVGAAIHVQHDEANGVGDGDGEESHLPLRQDQPLLAVLVFDDVLGHLPVALGVGQSGLGVVVEAVPVLLVGGQRNAAGKLPGLDNNVTALDEGQEAGEEGVLVEHVVDGLGVLVAVEPQPQARAGQVLGVEVALDEDLDAPGGGACPVDVVWDDGAGTGANARAVCSDGALDGDVLVERLAVAVGVDVVSLAGVLGAGAVGGLGERVVAVLLLGKEVEAVVGFAHLLDAGVRAPALLNQHVDVGLGVDVGAGAQVVVLVPDGGEGAVEDIGVRVDGDGLGGAGELDLDASRRRLDQLRGAGLVEEGGNANLAPCGDRGVVDKGDEAIDGGVEQGSQQQVLEQRQDCAEFGHFGHGTGLGAGRGWWRGGGGGAEDVRDGAGRGRLIEVGRRAGQGRLQEAWRGERVCVCVCVESGARSVPWMEKGKVVP